MYVQSPASGAVCLRQTAQREQWRNDDGTVDFCNSAAALPACAACAQAPTPGQTRSRDNVQTNHSVKRADGRFDDPLYMPPLSALTVCAVYTVCILQCMHPRGYAEKRMSTLPRIARFCARSSRFGRQREGKRTVYGRCAHRIGSFTPQNCRMNYFLQKCIIILDKCEKKVYNASMLQTNRIYIILKRGS